MCWLFLPAFISYHVMSAKTRVLKCCRLLFDWTEFWESSTLLNRESWLAYDDFREKTWLDHGTESIFFLPKRLHSTKSYFIKAIDHTFVNCCLPFTAAIPKTQNFLLQINRSSFAWKCNCRFERARLQPKESLWHRTNFQPVEIRTFSVHAEPT